MAVEGFLKQESLKNVKLGASLLPVKHNSIVCHKVELGKHHTANNLTLTEVLLLYQGGWGSLKIFNIKISVFPFFLV